MIKHCLLVLALVLPARAAAEAPLAALLTTEQRQSTPDGLTKTVRFQERLVRTRDRVWLERVLPAWAEAPSEEGHHHPDLDLAARDLSRDPQGGMHLALVHRGERTVFTTEPRDYPELGFHDSWAVAYHLADPGTLRSLKRLDRPAPAGATWYGRKDANGYLRILWSTRHRIALAVESGSADGRRSHRTTVALRPLPARLPWQELEGYRTREYMDLLD